MLSDIKDENYINIQGWMRSQFNLKGVDLLIYAIIYGFSQDGDSYYKGGLKYLQDWCGSSKPTVISSLKNLVEKEYIIKKEVEIARNLKLCEYQVNTEKIYEYLTGGKKILPNNKDYIYLKERNYIKDSNNITKDQSILNNKDILNKSIIDIINYINLVLGKKFLPGTKSTRQSISARMSEGYTVEDFKTVIDHQYAEWKDDARMSKYLCPETLFRQSNFEKYYNAAISSDKNVKDNKQSDKAEQQEQVDFWSMTDEEYDEYMRTHEDV